MAYIKVKLFGKEIGRLVWESSERRSYFMYNPQYKGMIPDIAPLLSPAGSRNEMLPVYGDDRPIYQGLPPFIADSLPDSWGNTLFDKWVKDYKIPRNKITPLLQSHERAKNRIGREIVSSRVTHEVTDRRTSCRWSFFWRRGQTYRARRLLI